jgi:hypothetical protein
LYCFLRDAAWREVFEPQYIDLKDKITAARAAFAASPTKKAQAAACRALGLTRADGKRGVRFNAEHAALDYCSMRIGAWPWLGRSRTPEEAIEELRRLYGLQSRNSCVQGLERYVARLRKELAEEEAAPYPEEWPSSAREVLYRRNFKREMLEGLADIPKRKRLKRRRSR